MTDTPKEKIVFDPCVDFDSLPPAVQEAITAHAKYYAEHHKLGMSIKDDMTYIAKVAMRWKPAESATVVPKDDLAKVIADLQWTRKQEAAGVMAMANSDETMFENIVRRLKTLSDPNIGADVELLDEVARLRRELAEARKEAERHRKIIAAAQACDGIDMGRFTHVPTVAFDDLQDALKEKL